MRNFDIHVVKSLVSLGDGVAKCKMRSGSSHASTHHHACSLVKFKGPFIKILWEVLTFMRFCSTPSSGCCDWFPWVLRCCSAPLLFFIFHVVRLWMFDKSDFHCVKTWVSLGFAILRRQLRSYGKYWQTWFSFCKTLVSLVFLMKTLTKVIFILPHVNKILWFCRQKLLDHYSTC